MIGVMGESLSSTSTVVFAMLQKKNRKKNCQFDCTKIINMLKNYSTMHIVSGFMYGQLETSDFFFSLSLSYVSLLYPFKFSFIYIFVFYYHFFTVQSTYSTENPNIHEKIGRF